MIKTSARNHLAGTVTTVQTGAVNDVIELQLQGGQPLVATVTSESTRHLGLAPGREVIALIKASSVLVGLHNESLRLSARNQLVGSISVLTPGAVNAEVEIQLPDGGVMVAVITNGSVQSLGLREGMKVVAIIKASQVILGTTD
jgi:molybdate transport system regulatory protein